MALHGSACSATCQAKHPHIPWWDVKRGWSYGGKRSTPHKQPVLWAPPERRVVCWPTKTALWRRAPGKQPSCAVGMHRPRRWGADEGTARVFCNVLRAPEGATRARPPWHGLLFAYLPYRQRIPAGDTAHRPPRPRPIASAAYPSHLATWRRGRCLSHAIGGYHARRTPTPCHVRAQGC